MTLVKNNVISKRPEIVKRMRELPEREKNSPSKS